MKLPGRTNPGRARKHLVLGDTAHFEPRCPGAFQVEDNELVHFIADQLPVLVLPRVEVVASGREEIELRVQPRFDGVRRGADPEAVSPSTTS